MYEIGILKQPENLDGAYARYLGGRLFTNRVDGPNHDYACVMYACIERTVWKETLADLVSVYKDSRQRDRLKDEEDNDEFDKRYFDMSCEQSQVKEVLLMHLEAVAELILRRGVPAAGRSLNFAVQTDPQFCYV